MGRKDADRKIGGPRYLLIPLLLGVETWMARFGRDGKSFLYPVTSGSEVTFYRQGWRDGQLIGKPPVVLKLPFAFHQAYQSNAYDFSRDLSTIVYARPGGQADLYFLSYVPSGRIQEPFCYLEKLVPPGIASSPPTPPVPDEIVSNSTTRRNFFGREN